MAKCSLKQTETEATQGIEREILSLTFIESAEEADLKRAIKLLTVWAKQALSEGVL